MAQPGVCTYCGVTDAQVDGDKLFWHDADRTCCSKYACRKQHHEAPKKPAPSTRKYGDRYKGWGTGAIFDDLRKRQRRRFRRRNGKAA